jgi:hypothetical protein
LIGKNSTRFECVLHLLRPFRVYFHIFSTRFECSFQPTTRFLADYRFSKIRVQSHPIPSAVSYKTPYTTAGGGGIIGRFFQFLLVGLRNVGSFRSVAGIFPTRFECVFKSFPPVSSAFYIFSTRLECVLGFHIFPFFFNLVIDVDF